MPTLDFKGKSLVYAHHLSVPARTLEPNAKKSLPLKGGKTSLDDNLIIHGDNLHALKALMPRYAGRIKCIYIDPPYNTGNEGWIYNDNVNSPMMQEWLKDKSPVDGEDLERHDKWLCMMWPRLHLLRELLAEDGVIFISIDDNEQHRARMVPMARKAAEVFAGLPRTPDNPWVFPGRKKGTRLVNLNDSWDHVRERAGLDGVRLHDLRHTFASRALALGEGLPMIGDLLGHRKVSTTARYAHLARDSVRVSSARVAADIGARIMAPDGR